MLLFGWCVLAVTYVDGTRVRPRIVPYFPADVPGPEMNSLHYALTFPKSSRTSSTVVASSSRATCSLLTAGWQPS